MKTTLQKKSLQKITKIAKVLKIVSHPVRLQILEVLGQQEPLSVSEIKKEISIEVEQSMLSHHLIKMKDSGVLVSCKNGKHNFYSLLDRQVLKVLD